MNGNSGWFEPIVPDQSLFERETPVIPDRYVKPPAPRSSFSSDASDISIPIIDLQGLTGEDDALRAGILNQISEVWRGWGLFQIVNHGVPPGLMDQTRGVWREFFHLPTVIKQKHANSQRTYEGYGNRLGVEKRAILDRCDYYCLDYLPLPLKDSNKWPGLPTDARGVIEEYGNELVKLCDRLMKLLSMKLVLQDDFLQNALGGDNIGVCLRVNFYPLCPQPDLTLGLSCPDLGCMTLLLPDDQVAGLQVLRDDKWITVKPARYAFIFNIGDQIQIKRDIHSISLEEDRMNPNVNVTAAASVGVGERFPCADHGNRDICPKCLYKDFISQHELFRKTLPKADTGHKFYIKREHQGIFTSPEFGFLSSENGEEAAVNVAFYDVTDRKRRTVQFVKSADGRCHLTKWLDFAREKKLSEGDVITFYKLTTKRGTFLMIGVEKAPFLEGLY